MSEKHRFLSHLKAKSTKILKFSNQPDSQFQDTRKEKVTDLAQLKPGDHISFYRSDLSYSHHGIVREVLTDSFFIIHYFNTAANAWQSLIKGSLYFAEVVESEWKVDLKSYTEELYLHHYDDIKCFSHEETLQRAKNDLGKRGYSLISNNCEHWARWCRTGDVYSEQVSHMRHRLKLKIATLLIVDPTALFVKDVTIVTGASLGKFLSDVGSGVVLGAVETVSTLIDIRRRQIERQQGGLSDIAFKKFVVRRVISGSATIAGGVAGTIIGSILIPVPIVGPVVGSMIGTLSGKILGGLAGIPIAKFIELYNKYKHENLNETETISRLMGLITSGAEEAPKESNATHSTLYSLFEQLIQQYPFMANEKCLEGAQLVQEIFSDPDDFESLVLTPIPDENAPEQFASMTDLLILRWPSEMSQPWNKDNEEYVLSINQ